MVLLDLNDENDSNKNYIISSHLNTLKTLIAHYIDSTTIYSKTRWCVWLVLFLILVFRIVIYEGFYALAYMYAISLLNLLVGFIAPQIDPETDEPVLPLRLYSMEITIIAIIGTLFSFLDLPVFWPLLVLYFIIIFIITMKKQIQHMIKHRYIPISFGKERYSGQHFATKNNKSMKHNLKQKITGFIFMIMNSLLKNHIELSIY